MKQLITFIEAANTTLTAPANGTGVNVSSILDIGQDWTLVLEIVALTTGASARIQFTDSTDNFVDDITAGPTVSVEGPVGPTTGVNPSVLRLSWTSAQFPSLRIGVAGAKLRLDLTLLTGENPSITYQAYVVTAQ